MRKLVLLVGIPGSGKSTWIKDNNLQDYTLSWDTMRLQNFGSSYDHKGRETIHNTLTAEMKRFFGTILSNRFSKGELTIIDNTNCNIKDFNFYSELAKPYGYSLHYKLFNTDKSICKERMKLRKTNYVNSVAINRLYSSLQNLVIPSNYKPIVDIEDLTPEVKEYDYRGLEFYVIGDLHGCYNEFKKFIDKEYKPDKFYFFVGDYVDRGYNNKDIITELIRLKRLNSNIILLEGNHEKWLRYWAHGRTDLISSNEFLKNTLPDLESAKSSSKLAVKKARNFLRDLNLFSLLKTDHGSMLITHGGVNSITNHNTSSYKYRSADSYIKGDGTYGNLLAFHKQGSDKDIVVHGHRNVKDIFKTSSSDGLTTYYDLEGGIEKGKNLKYIKVTPKSITTHTISSAYNYELDMNRLIEELQKSKLIRVSKCKDENTKAFNFTRDAFIDKKWTKLVCKARGLFIDTQTKKVVGRGYSKFFNFRENEHTSEESIKKSSFPIKAFIKHNGYLGILYSVGATKEDLRFNSKSGDSTDYGEHFKTLFTESYEDKILDYCAEWLYTKNYSLAVEVIDSEFDPHLTHYENSQELQFLDLIENSPVYKKGPISEFIALSTVLTTNISPKNELKKVGIHKNLPVSFLNSYEELLKYMEDNKRILHEGFVFEDSKGFMFKWKSPNYLIKKYLRAYLNTQNKTLLYRSLTQTGILGSEMLSEDTLKELVDLCDEHHKTQTSTENEEIYLDINRVDEILKL